MAESKADAEALVPKFKLEKVLNQDQAGRRTALLGDIDSKPALLVLERAPWPDDEAYLSGVPSSLAPGADGDGGGRLRNLGANDVYRWYMGKMSSSSSSPSATTAATATASGAKDEENGSGAGAEAAPSFHPDVKVNLIYPCTAAHVKKYSRQAARLVRETPEAYARHVRPHAAALRAGGRLNWVFNILDGLTEQEDVIYRTEPWGQLKHHDDDTSDGGGDDGDDDDDDDEKKQGFLLLPDLNWDRKTIEALHLLALVERRDLWSLRDLKKKHVPWLRAMRDRLVDATVATYRQHASALEPDQLKLYVHYQPTYYHLHVHIVHVALEAGATQAAGKAVGLESIIETLEAMGGGGNEGMDKLTMAYTVGEASDLWTQIFEPLKRGEEPSVP
ncbi:hypothetical protein N3K66_001978 [Trichothecium roseum]|uniref:Uncharacterized protein n=1 Tax=Trichothecium roseum TaxID=47278 RepID=A0ACC0V8B1_9HYPO|nr:hypothetical protein N3K66_001978 [Trichothecium roseum]